MSKPDAQGGTQVSRQEELLYGSYAPVVRQLGAAVVAVERAERALHEMFAAASEADSVTLGKTDPGPGFDRHGQSAETRWLSMQHDRLGELLGLSRSTHVDMARLVMARHTGRHDDHAAPIEGVNVAISNAITADTLATIALRIPITRLPAVLEYGVQQSSEATNLAEVISAIFDEHPELALIYRVEEFGELPGGSWRIVA